MYESRRGLILLGGGGHACVLLDILNADEIPLTGYVSPIESQIKYIRDNLVYLGPDRILAEYCDHVIVPALGILVGSNSRRDLIKGLLGRGFQFGSVIASSAHVSANADIGYGVQILPGAVINAGAKIGDFSIINTGAVVEHDCIVGSYSHVAPSVTLCGGVVLGESCFVSAGATVYPRLSFEDGSLIEGLVRSAKQYMPIEGAK